MKTYAVMFFSKRTPGDREEDYDRDADAMVAKVSEQPGYLKNTSVRDTSGYGITVSYWRTLESILLWRSNEDHRAVQSRGRKDHYESYVVRRAEVLKEEIHSMEEVVDVLGEESSYETLLKEYFPTGDEECYYALIITINRPSISTLRGRIETELSGTDYSGLEYVTDKSGNKSIALIYWADETTARTWHDDHLDLFDRTDCKIEICHVERTHSFIQARVQL